MRHQQNAIYQELLTETRIDRYADLIGRIGGTAPFVQGLYGSSEMLVNGFLSLYQDGILKRQVYDNVPLQRLLNEGVISESVDERTLRVLLERGVIATRLTGPAVEFLRQFGIFNDQVRYADGELTIGGGGASSGGTGSPRQLGSPC